MSFADFLDEAYPEMTVTDAVADYSCVLRKEIARAKMDYRYGFAAELEKELSDLKGWYENLKAEVSP